MVRITPYLWNTFSAVNTVFLKAVVALTIEETPYWLVCQSDIVGGTTAPMPRKNEISLFCCCSVFLWSCTVVNFPTYLQFGASSPSAWWFSHHTDQLLRCIFLFHLGGVFPVCKYCSLPAVYFPLRRRRGESGEEAHTEKEEKEKEEKEEERVWEERKHTLHK